jgi:type I restriction-modification system DNA methylase subunit
LVELVEPKEGMNICDPTCGSGGMLIECMKYVSQHGGNPRNLVLEGQEGNYGTLEMALVEEAEVLFIPMIRVDLSQLPLQ